MDLKLILPPDNEFLTADAMSSHPNPRQLGQHAVLPLPRGKLGQRGAVLPTLRYFDQFGRGLGHGFGSFFFAAIDALGMDERDIGDADEAENLAQVRFLKIVIGPSDEAAAGSNHECFFTVEHGDDALLGDFKGHVGADDLINPGLERGGDRKVMHRRGDEQGVAVK